MAETPDIAAEPLETPQRADPASRLREAFGRLSSQQKIILAVAVAAIVAILVGAYLWSRQPEYRVLFANVSDKDGAAIIAALEQSGVPYRFSENGSAILVSAERVHDVRLRLAGQGLPRGGAIGFELMENQKFGTSQFTEQVNYQRALEGELARTIESISAVDAARVHLAIPKPSVFVREEQKPSASVLLRLLPGRVLEPSQVAGISHLIASSVPQLPLSNVTIADQNGNLLSLLKDRLQEAGLDPGQLKYVHEIENGVIKRIGDILTPVVGTGNYRVQVAADLDFAQTEQTSETYDPDPSMRSQQVSESANLDRPPQGGVPGALSNQPPVPATAPITQPPVGPVDTAGVLPTPASLLNQGRMDVAGVRAPLRDPVTPPLATHKSATTNYEIGRTIRHTRQPVGGMRRLTAAVVVNYRMEMDAKAGKELPRPLPDAEIAQITNLVRQAMGYNAERGDSISVANVPFTSDTLPEEVAPFWKNPEYIAPGLEIARYLVLAAIVFILYWTMIRPVFRTMFPPPPPLPGPEEGGEIADGESPEGATGEGEPAPQADPFERKLQEAREFARGNPKAVAHIINDWLKVGG
ncbi:MAG: flagellar M-ring protein FliF [Zoogloeaceae bacterium]|jgi:flagellar M-ring protein FliF|nr:flagellar M-ring protein FliF [Zoogloeaceae bacterium]